MNPYSPSPLVLSIPSPLLAQRLSAQLHRTIERGHGVRVGSHHAGVQLPGAHVAIQLVLQRVQFVRVLHKLVLPAHHAVRAQHQTARLSGEACSLQCLRVGRSLFSLGLQRLCRSRRLLCLLVRNGTALLCAKHRQMIRLHTRRHSALDLRSLVSGITGLLGQERALLIFCRLLL